MENVLHDRLFKGSIGILLSIFMQIVASPKRWMPEYKEKIWTHIRDVELPEHQYENTSVFRWEQKSISDFCKSLFDCTWNGGSGSTGKGSAGVQETSRI